MSRGKKKGRGGGNFVMLPHYLVKSAAWRDLSANARALYIEIVLRFNGTNNGSIGLGNREAAEALNVKGKDTARRAFDELMEHGFIALGQASSFGQKRLSREWLLTDHHDDRNGQGARKDFMRWPHQKQNIGAPTRQIGAPTRLCGKKVPQEAVDRRTHAPVIEKPDPDKAHPRATYISSHRHSIDGERSQSVAHTQSDATAQAPRPIGELVGNIVALKRTND